MSRWFLLLFILTATVNAEELDVIEVEATKDIGRFTFGDSATLPPDKLEESATLAPMIENLPGIISSQNGGPGGRVSFFIRGTESRHVAFTMDGLKINDSSNVDRQFDAAFMTSPFLQEVLVHKGPQAVLYGSDAMGGIVEMKTRRGENAPETRLLLNGGSFGTVDATLSSDWKTPNNNGTVTYTRFHTDGISRLNEKRFNATEKDSADITQFTSSSEHRWASKFQTDLLGSYLHGKAEQDGFGVDSKHDHGVNDQYILQQKTSYDISHDQAVSLRNGLSRHQRFNRSESVGEETYGGNLYQNELLYRKEQERLGILAGLSNEQENIHSDSLDKQFELNSAFLQTSLMAQNFKLQAGARADHHSRYDEFFTGSAGVAYDLKSQIFSIQYSQGYKAPSLYQLYGPPLFGFPVGNEDLIPESNHSWEASWKLIRDNINGGVTFFQNRLSNLITYTNQGYINQSRFIAEGVEFFASWKNEKFEIAPSYTHQNFREEETTVLRRPYNMAQLSVSYFPIESIELNVTDRWFSSRKDIDENGNVVKLNGFSVLDIGIRKIWERDDVGLQFKNVLDREYEELYGYSVMPFSIFAHYGHRF